MKWQSNWGTLEWNITKLRIGRGKGLLVAGVKFFPFFFPLPSRRLVRAYFSVFQRLGSHLHCLKGDDELLVWFKP
jgi:hypothetical protein